MSDKAPDAAPPAQTTESAAAPAAPSVVASASSAVTAAASAASDSLQKMGVKPTLIVIGLIVVSLIAFVVAYGLYYLISKLILDKKSYLFAETKMPIVGTQYTQIVGTDIPKADNGKRMAFSFWIFINDINMFSGARRHVFHRGNKGDTANLCSPNVELDKTTNKIYVSFAKNTAAAAGDDATTAQKLAAIRGIIIDYVPLQRWVHIAVVVNENSNGGSVTTYMDGEIVKTVTSGAVTMVDGIAQTANVVNMDLDKTGDIWIGGSPAETVGPGFSGLLAKLRWFNYDINANDVYNEYMQGPIDNLMAKLGLPAYGVRSPIYRIG
jgi:phosphate/sulfate permease